MVYRRYSVKNMNSVRAFTLVELLVSIILMGIIAFFVYTMVIYSYAGFCKLSSHSRNFDDIKFLISSLRNTVISAEEIRNSGGQSFFCTRYDRYYGFYGKIEEEYKFLDGNRLENNVYAKTIDLHTIPVSKYPNTRGELYKITYIYDMLGIRRFAFKNKISSCIRKIFYYFDSSTNRLDMYVIYDDVIGGVLGRGEESYVTKGQWLCFSLRNKVSFI